MTRRIAIYLDGADLKVMAAMIGRVDGVTTNPSILKRAGVTDYRAFAREVLAIAGGKPVSFEVLADDFETMTGQAREIAGWGENVLVKIPVVNGDGLSTGSVIEALTRDGIRVNVTAIMTSSQAVGAMARMRCAGNIVSVFAGRIADAGFSPRRTVVDTLMTARRVSAQVLWASARQVYSVIEAEQAGADIITLQPEMIAKLDGFGRDLEQFSLETVKQFVKDAEGITL